MVKFHNKIRVHKLQGKVSQQHRLCAMLQSCKLLCHQKSFIVSYICIDITSNFAMGLTCRAEKKKKRRRKVGREGSFPMALEERHDPGWFARP